MDFDDARSLAGEAQRRACSRAHDELAPGQYETGPTLAAGAGLYPSLAFGFTTSTEARSRFRCSRASGVRSAAETDS